MVELAWQVKCCEKMYEWKECGRCVIGDIDSWSRRPLAIGAIINGLFVYVDTNE